MATVTPNFNWPVPTSTDLVKDGATAIEALGDSIDASLVDLKGGTTGQVLAKATNTDMDFIWVTDAGGDITGVTAGTGISGGGTSGTVTVTNSMATAIDAKGDLVVGTAADTFSRLAVGTNGQVLTADSAEATGLKWTTSASGSMTQLASGSLSSSVDLTSISSSYKNLTLIIRNFLPTATDGAAIAFRFNSDTNARYATNNTGNATDINFAGNERITTNDGQDSGTSQSFIKLDLWDYTNTTTWKIFSCLTWTNNPTTSANANMRSLTGAYNQTGAISTINIFNNYGTATTGTYVLFGVN